MALIDSGSKSSRLLASRRYTHDTLTTAQESFTNVLDLRTDEIYTQAAKIPSSGLPHSGSSQSGSYYTNGGDNILKYWYRHSLTKSNLNNETWFFLSPSGSSDGVGAQLISDNQEVNFVSPKYSLSSLATSTTEDSTPGYLAVLYKATHATSESLDSGDIVSTNDYIFDYKTGVVQFMNSAVDPSDSDFVYMSINQYVGTTLSTGLELDGSVSGSSTSTGSFGSLDIAGNVEFGEYIYHKGDADTFIQFTDDDDRINIKTGGVNMIYIVEGSGGDQADKVTINNDLADVDFQVKGDNEANLIRTDAATDRVGIGTSSPGVAFHVVGHISGSQISSSGDIVADGDVIAYNSSDIRLKDNIEVIKGSLDKIDGIRGVEFDWNEKAPGWARERGHDVGVIAQEVQKVLPEVVQERKNGFLGVDYKRLVPLLIESIKELKQEVEDLKKKVN